MFLQAFGTVKTVPYRAFCNGRQTIKWLVGPGSPDPAETCPERTIKMVDAALPKAGGGVPDAPDGHINNRAFVCAQ